MSHFTGISRGQGAFFQQLWHVLQSLAQINVWTFLVGATALCLLFLLGSYARRVPSALAVLTLGVLAVKLFGLDQHGVEVVGVIQARMPPPGLPRAGPDDLPDIALGTVGIVLVLMAEALTTGRTFAAKHKYEIDPNQELLAMGAANFASGFFGGMIVGGGMSGTAASDASGARTQFAAMVSAAFVALTVVFLLPFIRLLPEAVLAAVVIHAVAHLVDFRELSYYVRIRTGSIWVALTAITGVLLFGISKGLVLAIGLTLIGVMIKLSAPQESVLGQLPGTDKFVDMRWNPEARPVRDLLIVRPNAILFFANASRVLNTIRTLLRRAKPSAHAVILDLEASPDVDITSVEMLSQLNDELNAAGVTLYFAKVPNRVLDLFKRSGFLPHLRENQICDDVSIAVKIAGKSAIAARA